MDVGSRVGCSQIHRLDRRPVGPTLFGRLADLNDDHIGQLEDLLPTSFGRGAGANILIKYLKNKRKKDSSSSIHCFYCFFILQHVYYNLDTVTKLLPLLRCFAWIIDRFSGPAPAGPGSKIIKSDTINPSL